MKSITYIRVLTVLCILIWGAITQNTWPLVPSSVWDDLETLVYRGMVGTKPAVPSRPSRVVMIEADAVTISSYGWPLRRDALFRLFNSLAERGRPWVVSLIHFRDTTASGTTAASRQELAKENQRLAVAMADYGRVLGSGLAFRLGEELSTYQEEHFLPRALFSKDENALQRLPYFAFTLLDDNLYLDSLAGFGLGTGFTFDDDQVCVPLYADTVGDPGAYTFPTSLVLGVHKMNPGRNKLRNGLRLSQDVSTGDVFHPLECLPQPSLSTGAYLLQQQIPIISLRDIIEQRVPIDLSDKLVILGSTEGWRFRDPAARGNGERLIPEHFLLARFADRLLEQETIGRNLHVINHGKDTYSWLLGVGWAWLAFLISPLRMWILSAVLLLIYSVQIYIPFLQGQLLFDPARLSFLWGALTIAGGSWFSSRLVVGARVTKFREQIRIGFSDADNLERLINVAAAACRGNLREGRLKALHCHELMRLSATPPHELLAASPPQLADKIPVARCSSMPKGRGRRILISGKRLQGDLRIHSRPNPWLRFAEERFVRALAQEIVSPWHRIEFSTLQRYTDAQALRLQADLELGREVQKLTLPKDSFWQIPGGQAQIDFKPLNAMSGDWYQSFHRADGKLSILAIGDVVGKGPSAALATTVIAAEWRRATEIWETELPDLNKFLAALHNTLFSLFQGEQNTTISLVVVTPGQVRCLRSGSPPWLFFEGANKVSCRSLARGPSPLIGCVREYRAPREEVVILSYPSTIIAFSDGVFATSVEVQRARQHIASQALDLWKLEDFRAANLLSSADDDQTLICLYLPGTSTS